MKLAEAVNGFRALSSSGRVQQTLAGCVEMMGKGLHSGEVAKVRLWPELAGKGRYFEVGHSVIPSSIDVIEESPLCTSLCKDGVRVRTVEHLLSALEGLGVDNCRIENLNSSGKSVEVPILDGSAEEWESAIEEIDLTAANDQEGSCYRPPMAFIWLYGQSMVEKMKSSGLIKGGSTENAIVCSSSTKGWLNPPLRFSDEPCRHKVLDLIGHLSLFAAHGNQGLPVAHIVAYKAGHALHAVCFVDCPK